MLILHLTLLTLALTSATDVRSPTVSPTTTVPSSISSIKSKRGVVENRYNIRHGHRQPKANPTVVNLSSLQEGTTKSPSQYRTNKFPTEDIPQSENYGSSRQSQSYGNLPKHSSTYVDPSTRQSQFHKSDRFAPYYGNIHNNPEGYKIASDAGKSTEQTKSTESVQKLRSVDSTKQNSVGQNGFTRPSSLSNFEYPQQSRFAQNSPGNVYKDAPAAVVQIPVYKTNYPLVKPAEFSQSYSPTFRTTGVVTSTEVADKTTQSVPFGTDDVKGKIISLPTAPLQNAQLLQGFQSQQLAFPTTGLDYQPNVGFNFGLDKTNVAFRPASVSPFLSPASSFQAQMIPIQTSGNQPQFPQYKGASIEVYPGTGNFGKVPGAYEPLLTQPQLHFGNVDAVQPVGSPEVVAYNKQPVEDVKEDAEILNKKSAVPSKGEEEQNRDLGFDEGYKNLDKEYGQNSEEDYSSSAQGKDFKESRIQINFKPSYPFKEYDERFGKYSKQNYDGDTEEKPFSQYRGYSSSDEQDETSSKYRLNYAPKSSQDTYEDEDEEESRKYERREAANDEEDYDPERYRFYGKDFEEFESLKRPSKYKYIHVKETPDYVYKNVKSSKIQQNNPSKSYANREESGESTDKKTREISGHKQTPKNNYNENGEYNSNVSVKKAPKVMHEEYYGFGFPNLQRREKYSKASENNERYSTTEKLPKEDSYVSAAKSSYKLNSPRDESGSPYQNGDYYSHSSDGKPNKSSSGDIFTSSSSVADELVKPDEQADYYGPNLYGAKIRSLATAEVLRDLIGI